MSSVSGGKLLKYFAVFYNVKNLTQNMQMHFFGLVMNKKIEMSVWCLESWLRGYVATWLHGYMCERVKLAYCRYSKTPI
jgi:hypothetical protein